jgi:hypothetical protein
VSPTYPYLGTPGAMQQLPGPNGSYDRPSSRHETVHTLIGGGTAVTKRLRGKGTYTLPYTSRPGVGLDDLLSAFYDGMFGDLLVYVDPVSRNVLPLDTSTFGLRVGGSQDWTPSTGSLAYATSGGPAGVTSGVLTWSSLAAAATLTPGSAANTASILTAPVYLPGEAVSVSMWLKASSASTVTLRLSGFNAAGVFTAAVTSSASLTTSWQAFSTSAAAGNGTLAGSVFVLPQILLGGTVPTSVSAAGAQLEYASPATAFQRGYGSPRVVIPSSPGFTVPNVYGWSTHSLVLNEV